MKDRYLWWCRKDVELERRHAVEEGRDIAPLADEFAALSAKDVVEDESYQRRVNALMDAVQTLPVRADFPYVEPSDLEGIRAQRPAGAQRLELGLSDEQLLERFAGAWLGRCAGCLLGIPLEGVRTPALWGALRDAGHAGLTDYMWRMPIDEAVLAKYDLAKRPGGHRNLTAMPQDDDTNWTTSALAIVEQHGLEFTPTHVADFWLNNVPIMRTFTAERIAYRNFVAGIEPPRSATHRNPCREWIGAQIRGDFFGYVCAGRPELAAELAWRDACISHTRNGIYGEMWVAAMLAAAPAVSDVREAIVTGLGEVPQCSRFAEGLRDVLDWRARGLDYAEAIVRVHHRWDEHNWHDWHHTVANAQLVAIALLWSGGDFGRAITGAVYPGFDTDCNGATAGSVTGMLRGAGAIDRRWTDVMNDTMHTGVAGYQTVKISDMARRTFELYRKLLG